MKWGAERLSVLTKAGGKSAPFLFLDVLVAAAAAAKLLQSCPTLRDPTAAQEGGEPFPAAPLSAPILAPA